MNSTNFKLGDIVKIKDRDNPNNWSHSGIRFCNMPRKVIDLDIDLVKVYPPLEIYIQNPESGKWAFSNYNDTLGIDTLEYANVLNLDNKLFEL